MPRIAAPDGSSTGSNAGGSAFNFACDAGSAQPEQPSSSEISDLFTSIHALAQPDTARNQPRISTLGFQLAFHSITDQKLY
jgi:hypothetical protein